MLIFGDNMVSILAAIFDASFCGDKKGADSLEHWLCMNGFPATTIHGDRTQQVGILCCKVYRSTDV